MKKFIAGFLSGALLFGIGGAFAVNSIYDNPYKIFVNGEEKQIQGYNVDDYSYFKLRDIADAVGGFTVDFKDDTIQLYKDGYTPPETPVPTSTSTLSPKPTAGVVPTSAPTNDNKTENLTYSLQNVKVKNANSISYYDEVMSVPAYGKYFNAAAEGYEPGNGIGEIYVSYSYDEEQLNEYCVLLETLQFRRIKPEIRMDDDVIVYKLGYITVELAVEDSKLNISAYRSTVNAIDCTKMINTNPVINSSFQWLTTEEVEEMEWISFKDLENKYGIRWYRNVDEYGNRDPYGLWKPNGTPFHDNIALFKDLPESVINADGCYFKCNGVSFYIDSTGNGPQINGKRIAGKLFSKDDLKKLGAITMIY